MQSEGGGTRTAAAERTDGREIYALAKERETERRTDGARTFDGSFEGSSRLDATMRARRCSGVLGASDPKGDSRVLQ